MTTFDEYMAFFDKWLNYQFPDVESDWDNYALLRTVSNIVKDPDDLAYWSNRDNWSMYDYAKKLAL